MITRISLADELTNFIKPFKPGAYRLDILRAVLKHIEFETIVYVRDKNGMAGCARFDIIGETACVLDAFVRRDCEHKHILKYLALEGWKRWSMIKFITFERLAKYPHRKQRVYKLAKLLKER